MNDALRREADRLAGLADGGRVAASAFLDDDDAAALLAELRRRDVRASADGGRPAAERRIVTARPAHLPSASTALAAIYLEGVHDPSAARAALRAAGVDASEIGDVVEHAEGVSVIVRASGRDPIASPLTVAGRRIDAQSVEVERVATGSHKRLKLVVPSLRADVLGAKAFGASRSWFSKGVAGGKVRVDGEPAGKSTSLEIGSELWAEGLGRARLADVEGETKRGNVKVVVEVERP